jgi:phage shock protein A
VTAVAVRTPLTYYGGKQTLAEILALEHELQKKLYGANAKIGRLEPKAIEAFAGGPVTGRVELACELLQAQRERDEASAGLDGLYRMLGRRVEEVPSVH